MEKTKKLQLGHGKDKGVDIPALCYKDLKDRVIRILDAHEKEGGKFYLDGRKYVNSKYPNGYIEINLI